jgi:MFS family permease
VDDAIDLCGGFGRFQWFILGFAGLSWMCDALEVMLLSFLGPAVECEWHVGPARMGALTSVVFAGMCIGGPLWGAISDGWGRRTSFAMSVVCTTVFGFLSAAARSFEVRGVLQPALCPGARASKRKA